MTTVRDGLVGEGASVPGPGEPSAIGGWRLIGSAFLWCVASLVAAGVMGFFAGVVIGATGLKVRFGPALSGAIYEICGALGASTIFVCVALTKGAASGGGDTRVGIGDGPITRPKTVALISMVIFLYASAISFGAFAAHPEALRPFAEANLWAVAAGFLIAVICAPLAEELFFRGWLWTGLRVKWGALAAASITGAMWLALHLPEGIGRTTLLLPLAVALSVARHFGGSVRAAVVVHACNNLAAAAMPRLLLWLGWLAMP
jgi:membrane protease YdiL (CAAX protease family)